MRLRASLDQIGSDAIFPRGAVAESSTASSASVEWVSETWWAPLRALASKSLGLGPAGLMVAEQYPGGVTRSRSSRTSARTGAALDDLAGTR